MYFSQKVARILPCFQGIHWYEGTMLELFFFIFCLRITLQALQIKMRDLKRPIINCLYSSSSQKVLHLLQWII